MTDKDRVRGLLDDFGIPFSENKNEISILVDYETHTKLVGYTAFRADFEFTDDGDFLKLGLWE